MAIIIKKLIIPKIEKEKEEKFAEEIESLCKKYAGKDYVFEWGFPKRKKFAVMEFKVEIKETDTEKQIEEKMYHEVESWLEVIGIRMDAIKIVEGVVE
jgi:hypothetical protein